MSGRSAADICFEESTMSFENLLKPIKINKYTYKNRIVGGPMVFGLLALDPRAREGQYRKIDQRAEGGAGCITIGETYVNFTDGDRIPIPYCDFTDYTSEAFGCFKHFADIIHKNDAVALSEISHPGLVKDPFPGQKNPVGPVSFVKENGVQVDGLDEENMARIANDFAVCAKFMTEAGFDGITVHGAHGWLIMQFLSPLTNTRDDEYGGSLKNRAKFPIRILKAIRKAIGPDKIIDLRISGEEGIEGGITADETGQFCHMLEGIVDSIHISNGLYYAPVITHQSSCMYTPHGINAERSAVIKK